MDLSYSVFVVQCIFSLQRCGPKKTIASSFLRFVYHTQRSTTVGMTPLDEWSARLRAHYLTTYVSVCDRRASIMKRSLLTKDFAPCRKNERDQFDRYRLIWNHNIKMDRKGVWYQNRYCTLMAQNRAQRRVIDNGDKYSGFNERINSFEQKCYREFRKRLLLYELVRCLVCFYENVLWK